MSDRDNTPEQRTEKLSKALAGFHDRSWKLMQKANWFAQGVERQLRNYLSIPEQDGSEADSGGLSPLCFFSFKAGYIPEHDMYEPKDCALEAIGVDADGFHTFGLGLELRMGPTVRPRYHFHWYVRVKIQEEDSWKFQVGVGNQQIIELPPRPKVDDLVQVVEVIYHGLLTWLECSSEGRRPEGRLGFVKNLQA